jgi:hypothetical protein
MFENRRHALDTIHAARDWPALFDGMSQALSGERLGWQDDEGAIQEAAFAWAHLRFLVGCKDILVIGPHRIDGVVARKEAFDHARAIACLCLSPLPDMAAWDALVPGLEALLEGPRVAGRHAAFGAPALPAGFLVNSKIRLSRMDHHEHAAMLFGSMETMDGFLFQNTYSGYGSTPPTFIPGLEGEDGEDRPVRSLTTPADLQGLCDTCALTHLQVGPNGGWQGVERAVAEFRDAVAGLSHHFNAPSSLFAQDRMGLSLNEVRVDVVAYFGEPSPLCYGTRLLPVLGFSSGLSCLGHEWVHAMEHFTLEDMAHADMGPTHPLPRAWKRVHPRIRALPQDKALAARRIHELAAAVTDHRARCLAGFHRMLQERGHPQTQASLTGPSARRRFFNIQDIVYADFLDRATNSPANTLPVLAASMEKWLLTLGRANPGAAFQVLTRHATLVQDAESQTRLLREGKSVFRVEAWRNTADRRWTKGKSKQPLEYFMQPAELLARAAESVFHTQTHPRFAYVQDGDWTCPAGSELAFIRPVIDTWLGEVVRRWEAKTGCQVEGQADEAKAPAAAPLKDGSFGQRELQGPDVPHRAPARRR